MKNIIAALMACLGTASSGYSQVITPQGKDIHLEAGHATETVLK